MKKFLLTFAAALGLAASANAQLALETFDASGPSGSLPAGWAMQNDGHTVSSSFTGISGLPAELTTYAWYPISTDASSNYQMITTSYFTSPATADRWLMTPSFNVTSPYMVIQWDDWDLNSGENIEVLASSTASTTTSTYTSLYSAPAGSGAMVTHQVALGAYNGTTIRVAFRDHTHDNWGLVIDNVETAIIDSVDMGMLYTNLPMYAQTGASQPVTGAVQNYAAVTVTSMNLNYSVNGGTPVTTSLTGLSIPLGSSYNFTASTPWVPATAGTYTIKIWADNINGYADENHSNDTVTTTVTVIDSLQPKMVMIEEFNQASCDPCAAAAPNVDSVYNNNTSVANIVRYHVSWPGRDCMDSVTWSPFVSGEVSLYSVSGVPDAQVDGYTVYPGAGYLTSALLRGEAAQGSPFKIVLTPSYDASSQTYSFTAAITAYADLPAGLKLRAALTVDTITYSVNQSTESIPQYSFPQVAENMFPNASGNTLSAFTAGSTQTVTGSWVKNHPWGSDYAHFPYTATDMDQIVVWVEDDSKLYIYQSAAQFVMGATEGVSSVQSNNAKLNVYPNPASQTAVVALDLLSSNDVTIEVYNITGQLMYSKATEHRAAGASSTNINLSNFASGDYIVRVSVGGEVMSTKLTVTK